MRTWNCPCGWVNNYGPDCGYCARKRPYTIHDELRDLRAEVAKLRAEKVARSEARAKPQGDVRADSGLAAADDNHKALVEAVARHVFMGALTYAFGYDAKTTDRLTLEQREATIQRLAAEATAAFQSHQEEK